MSGVLKFIVFCLLLYTAFMLLLKIPLVESGINSGFRSSVEWVLKQAFPDAYIETQNYLDANNQLDPNSFYLVYGNPKTIAAEEAYAAQQQLKEYKISTFSFQFFIFQMFVVPFGFLFSIFLASPMDWRKKLIKTGISALALLTLILIKTLLLTLFSIANTQIGIYTLSESQLSWVFHIISAMTLGFSVMFVFCLWLLLGFRNSKFNSMFSNYINQFKNEA